MGNRTHSARNSGAHRSAEAADQRASVRLDEAGSGAKNALTPNFEDTTMNTIKDTAARFFEACETGQGWEVCAQYCHPDASFTCQADALAEVTALESYVEWVKGLQGPIPDGGYEIQSFAVDEERGNVAACSVFSGTHSGEGGPVPATGMRAATDYVYLMQFDEGLIRHMTKIWNDGFALRQLGWA